jgi:hypothetical protein
MEDPGGPLNDAEFREMVRLLARFAERELDQFVLWKFNTSYGLVSTLISRAVPGGWPEESGKTFDTIWPLPAHLREDQHGMGEQQG